jgi:hypothetical protein
MEDGPVVKAVINIPQEVFHRDGSLVLPELDGNIPFGRFD